MCFLRLLELGFSLGPLSRTVGHGFLLRLAAGYFRSPYRPRQALSESRAAPYSLKTPFRLFDQRRVWARTRPPRLATAVRHPLLEVNRNPAEAEMQLPCRPYPVLEQSGQSRMACGSWQDADPPAARAIIVANAQEPRALRRIAFSKEICHGPALAAERRSPTYDPQTPQVLPRFWSGISRRCIVAANARRRPRPLKSGLPTPSRASPAACCSSISAYGTWALLGIAATPFPQTPALIFMSMARLRR
jgi:hypothetical protein